MGEDFGAGLLEGSHTKSGVPIEHLDYPYVEGCKNAKELEKILKVLRSGEEGHYPELIEFTEKKLEEVNPKSKSLRKGIPIKTYYDLSKEEKQGITDDLQEWVEKIDQADKSLKGVTHNGEQQSNNLPPVRSMGNSQSTSSDQPQQMETVKNVIGSAVPRGYHEWDKFDPDKEIEALDQKEMEERKQKQEKTRADHTEAIPSKVNFEVKSETERNILATREKEKGNEAFQSGHYKEALLYYSRSIQLDPTVAAVYNNRAIAEIKLEKFQEAIKDCDTVLSMEPNNVKAYLRRGIALRKQGKNEEAKTDLFRVLAIEPKNKRAKQLLSELEKNERSSQVQSSPTTANQSEKEGKMTNTTGLENGVPGSGSNAKKGRRLKIVEVEGDSREEPAEVLNGESCVVEESKPHANDLTPDHKVNRTVHVENVTATQPLEVTDRLQLPVLVEMAQNEGTRFFKLGRYAEAAEKYTEAIEILLKDKLVYRTALSSLLCNRASCLGRIGDCGGCIADCTAALELEPSSLRPLLKRAEAYETSEKYKKAWLDYQSALRIQPQSSTALQGNFRVSKHLESLYGPNWKQEVDPPGSAQMIFKSSATQDRFESSSTLPLPPKAVNVVTPIEATDNTRTQIGGASGLQNSARGNVRETIRATHPIPESDVPSTNLDSSAKFSQFKDRGNEFVKQGRLQDAVTCYTECINIDPKSVAVYTNRALCYVRLNKHDLAIQDTTEALTLQPGNVKALFRRALAKKSLGQYDSAARDLFQLQKIEPKNAAAKKELEVVLNMCREERRATVEKATEDKKKESSEKPKQSSPPETQPAENLQWRQIPIKDVQHDEEDDDTSELKEVRPTSTKPLPGATSNHSGQSSKTVKLLKNTAYDFYQAWNSVKKGNTEGHADLLRQLGSRSLASVLSNKLDATMFNRIVAAVTEEMLSKGEESLAYSILEQLCHVQRFDMVLLFLSAREKNELRDLFSKLEAARDQQNFVSSTEFVRLKKKYKM